MIRQNRVFGGLNDENRVFGDLKRLNLLGKDNHKGNPKDSCRRFW